MKTPALRCLAALLVIWGLAVAGMRMFRGSKPTAEQVASTVAEIPPDGLPPEQRTRAINTYISQVNRLPHDERRRLFHDKRVETFFNRLEPAEQLRVFDETLPSGLSEAIHAFNRMDEAERRSLLERARHDLERFEREVQAAARARDGTRREHVQALTERLSREGMRAYLREADANAKLELQPLLEQMHAILRRVNW